MSVLDTPIHIITTYIKPYDPDRQWIAHELENLLGLTIGRLPSSKIILMGNFNDMRREVEGIAVRYGISPTIKDGTPTHERGNTLDQVLKNLHVKSIEHLENPVSDHKLIIANLKFIQSSGDVNFKDMPVKANFK